MINSKLTGILGSFSKAELKEFEKFVNSPFFNNGRNYLPFLQQLKKFHPKFEDPKMTPEFIYAKLHPGKKFNKQVIWNLTSNLTKLAEEYLFFMHSKKNKFNRLAAIADEFSNRGLNSYYLKMIGEMAKFTSEAGIDPGYFQRNIAIQNGMVTYYQLEDKQHLLCQNVLEEGKWRILSIVRDLSRIVNDLVTNAFMYNAKYDINIPFEFVKNLNLDNVIKFAKERNYTHTDILEMYYCSILAALDKTDTAHYYRLKELFKKNHMKFSAIEKHDITTTLSNYCNLMVTEGKSDFKKEIFEINRFEIENDIAFPKTSPSKIIYIQILRSALTANEIDWAKNFAEKYIGKLKHSHQKPVFAMANAFINSKLGNYPAVLDNLKNIRFIDVRDKINVKSLQIRTYYELGETETVLYHIDSMKHFLNSNPSVSEQSKQNQLLFLSYLQRIVSAKEKLDIYDIELLIEHISKNASAIHREWLLEKTAEIKKGAQ